MKFTIFAPALFAALAVATPTPTTVEKRASYCGQWDSQQTAGYTVYNNLWGMSAGSGSQCTTLTGMSGNNLVWSTSWSWSGGQYNVKSYANAVVNFTQRAVSSVSSIPSTWTWR
jgi:xyloglucan-specific endo-beta-1,4-glucanase